MEKTNDRVFYSNVRIMSAKAKAPIQKDATFTVDGRPYRIEKKSGQYGDFLSVNLSATLPDSFTRYYFGEEFVRENHEVEFRFSLSGQNAKNFMEHTPRWGQTIVFQLTEMEAQEFTRRNGETGRSIACKCNGYGVIGSTKKDDGSERPVIEIIGVANAAAPAAAPAAAAPDPAEFADLEFFDGDNDLPF